MQDDILEGLRNPEALFKISAGRINIQRDLKKKKTHGFSFMGSSLCRLDEH